MLPHITIPEPQPAKKAPGYKMPEAKDHLLTWDFVDRHMTQATSYWINTVYRGTHPHVVHIWGIWYENRFHFEGRLEAAWVQNLLHNPHIAVHLPDGEKVIIIEGNAHIVEPHERSSMMWDTLDANYQTKYQIDQGSPYWYVQPKKAVAWKGADLQTMTCWVFD